MLSEETRRDKRREPLCKLTLIPETGNKVRPLIFSRFQIHYLPLGASWFRSGDSYTCAVFDGLPAEFNIEDLMQLSCTRGPCNFADGDMFFWEFFILLYAFYGIWVSMAITLLMNSWSLSWEFYKWRKQTVRVVQTYIVQLDQLCEFFLAFFLALVNEFLDQSHQGVNLFDCSLAYRQRLPVRQRRVLDGLVWRMASLSDGVQIWLQLFL